MKRLLPLLAAGAVIVAGATMTHRDVQADDVPSTARGRSSRASVEPYIVDSSLDPKFATMVVHAPKNSFVRIVTHVSIDVSAVSPSDPTYVAYNAFLEISPDFAPALSATSTGADFNGDGVTELAMPESRLDATIDNVSVMANSTYNMAHTKWQYVVDDGGSGELTAHPWRITHPQWDFLESLAPPVRTARNLWFTQSKASQAAAAPAGNPDIFSKTLMAEAALAAQLGQSNADALILTEVPNADGSIFSNLCAAGAVKLTVQACVITNPNQQEWNGVGAPIWTPAEGWEDTWVSWTHTLTWNMTIPYPLTNGGLGTIVVAPGDFVTFPFEGYAPPMTASIAINGNTYPVDITYVSRRVARFQVPLNAAPGPIVILSMTNPHVTWSIGGQGISIGATVQIPH